MSLRNLAEPVTLVRSPTFTKRMSSVRLNASSPESSRRGTCSFFLRTGSQRTRSAIALMCAGVVPQQPPTKFRWPACARSPSTLAVSSGASSYSPKALGRPGVRIHADIRIGEARQLFDIGTKLFDAERAIEADGDRARMAHRRPEGFHGLARERAPRSIGDRAGDDDGQIHACCIERGAHRVDSRLGVQRVENGFDEDGIRAALDETARGIAVGLHELDRR